MGSDKSEEKNGNKSQDKDAMIKEASSKDEAVGNARSDIDGSHEIINSENELSFEAEVGIVLSAIVMVLVLVFVAYRYCLKQKGHSTRKMTKISMDAEMVEDVEDVEMTEDKGL